MRQQKNCFVHRKDAIIQYLFSLVLLVMSPGLLQGQNCNDLFKQVMDKVKLERSSATSKGFEMAFQVRITMQDGQVTKENMEIKILGNKYHYTTPSMKLYQDDKTLVVINNANHSIYMTKPAAQQMQFDQILKLQDSVMNYFDIQSCKKEWGVVENGRGYYKMILVHKPKAKDMGVSSIIYWVDAEQQQVRKINVNYNTDLGTGIKEYELIINRMKYSLTTSPFLSSASGVVLDGVKLRSLYNGYSLLDKRK